MIKNIIFIFFIFCCLNSIAQIGVMSYNIRYDNPNDQENWWGHRKSELVQMLDYYHPDIFGLQEVLPKQLTYINDALSEFTYIGFGRDGENTNSESTPIFYDSSKIELINYKVFWLSNTPNIVSTGWDAVLPRIATYGKFVIKKSNQIIHIVNTHFDHQGSIARSESAKVILKELEKLNLNNEPIILMGDLNCEPSSEPYLFLQQSMKDLFLEVEGSKRYGPVGTWNAFDTQKIIEKRIDYIFGTGMEVIRFRHVDDKRKNNLHMSDHLPVLVYLRI